MTSLKRDTLFAALTRPQMFAGVTYTYFILNGILAAELFLITKSFWVLPISVIVHLIGVLLCLHEPRSVDLWLTRSRCCPKVKNYRLWQCNSYRA